MWWTLLALFGALLQHASGRLTEREKKKAQHQWKPPSYGGEDATDVLSPEIAKMAVDPWRAKEKSKKAGKPIMILLTKNGCPACKILKGEMNDSAELRDLLDRFVFVSSNLHDEQAMKYTGKLIDPPSYAPSTTFLAPGGAPLEVKGPHEKERFFSSASALLLGMREALDQTAAHKAATQERWREEIRALYQEHRRDGADERIAQHEGKLLTLLRQVRKELADAGQAGQQPCEAADEGTCSDVVTESVSKGEL